MNIYRKSFKNTAEVYLALAVRTYQTPHKHENQSVGESVKPALHLAYAAVQEALERDYFSGRTGIHNPDTYYQLQGLLFDDFRGYYDLDDATIIDRFGNPELHPTTYSGIHRGRINTRYGLQIHA